MARGILSEFGPDAPKSQAGRASRGGVMEAKPLRYSTPQGPTEQQRRAVGLGGDNLGVCGTQGKYGTGASESGSPGLGGENRGMGTNRKG